MTAPTPTTDLTAAPLAAVARIARWSAGRLVAHLAGGLLVWAVVALACVCVGSTGDVRWPADAQVRGIRLEIVLLSSLIGAALGAAGVAYQAILRNPLADPYLLGASSGAALCAYLWRLPAATWLAAGMLGAAGQQAFAFAGAIGVVGVVLAVSTRRGRLEPITLLLVGVIFNSINGALFLLLSALRPEITAGAGGVLNFLVGSVQTTLTSFQERAAALAALAGWIVLLWLGGKLNVAALAELEARSLGIHIHRLRWAALVTASVVTAAAVSISGPIGFIGLIAPHIARRFVGSDHRKLLPWGTMLGAALLCVADAASRLLAQQGTQLPVGVLTSLLGGPFFLALLWQSRGKQGG